MRNSRAKSPFRIADDVHSATILFMQRFAYAMNISLAVANLECMIAGDFVKIIKLGEGAVNDFSSLIQKIISPIKNSDSQHIRTRISNSEHIFIPGVTEARKMRKRVALR